VNVEARLVDCLARRSGNRDNQPLTELQIDDNADRNAFQRFGEGGNDTEVSRRLYREIRSSGRACIVFRGVGRPPRRRAEHNQFRPMESRETTRGRLGRRPGSAVAFPSGRQTARFLTASGPDPLLCQRREPSSRQTACPSRRRGGSGLITAALARQPVCTSSILKMQNGG
jgi:hypothetical protein